MILNNILPQILIILGVIVLFIVTFILNKKTKAPKVDDSDKCQLCDQPNCMLKHIDIDEMKKEVIKDCQERNDKHEE